MASGRYPTTDYGTVIVHWIIVAAFTVLLFTGLRIASDCPGYEWLAVLDPVLPMEHLWFRHMVAGTVLASAVAGYGVFIVQARLGQRIAVDRARLAALGRGGRAGIGALNGLVLWVLLASLAAEIATGTMLFLGAASAMIDYHMLATWTVLASATLHVGLHAAYGGVRQLLRIVRPAPLIVAPPPPDFAALLADHLRRENQAGEPRQGAAPRLRPGAVYSHPFATAGAVGLAVLAGAAQLESMTRQDLRIVEISGAPPPVLDGDLSDPAWRQAVPVKVMTTQGGDFGGTGESEVEIRALHDGDYAYFAFVWSDPTRSLKHLPLVKTTEGWHVARAQPGAADPAQANDPLEDKFSVLLARPSLPLIGAAIHLARVPLSDKPAGRSQRGLHFTDGGIADVWQWRASHAGTIGYVENCHFGGPAEAGAETAHAGMTPAVPRYSGGFARDPAAAAFKDNIATASNAGGDAVHPLRLPLDPRGLQAAMGRVSDDVGLSESEGARWWMSEAESTPYSPAVDNKIPVGTIVPSIVMLDEVKPERTSIRGVARWAAGRWTLELVRRLHTGSPYDLPIKTGTLMWVAAFDHSETRHTRHLRPLRLEVD